MPYALLTVDQTARTKLGSDRGLVSLATKIRDLIAGHLTSQDEEGRLKVDEVEVKIINRDWRHVGGEKYGVTLMVFANEYPNRRQDIEIMTLSLSMGLKGLLPDDITGYAWVLLCHAAFFEFGFEGKK